MSMIVVVSTQPGRARTLLSANLKHPAIPLIVIIIIITIPYYHLGFYIVPH